MASKSFEPIAEHILMGDRYILTVLSARPRRVKSKGREYWQYSINLPINLVRLFLEMTGEEPGTLLPLTILATPSPWYHLINWKAREAQRMFKRLPEELKTKIEALGLRDGGPVVLIPSRPEELRELGLDPEKPVTLKDIVEAVEKHVLEKLKLERIVR